MMLLTTASGQSEAVLKALVACALLGRTEPPSSACAACPKRPTCPALLRYDAPAAARTLPSMARGHPEAARESARRGCGTRRAEPQRCPGARVPKHATSMPNLGAARARTRPKIAGSGPGKREEAALDVRCAMRSSGARARYATCGEIRCEDAGRPAVGECHSLSASGRYLVLLF